MYTKNYETTSPYIILLSIENLIANTPSVPAVLDCVFIDCIGNYKTYKSPICSTFLIMNYMFALYWKRHNDDNQFVINFPTRRGLELKISFELQGSFITARL